MNLKNPKVEFFFTKTSQWKKEYEALREIILDCGLMEELKWGQPCYTLHSKNVVLIHGFKEYCALLFMKGVLMSDPDGILIQQTPEVHAPRQIRFTNVQEIVHLKDSLKAYVLNAIDVETSGIEVPAKASSELVLAEELLAKFKESPELKKAFKALTPGRQRAYNLFFTAAKQSATRISRIEKSIPQILMGKGPND